MNKPTDFQLLLRSMRYLLAYRPLVIGIYAAMILINLINITTPQLIRFSIDVGIYNGDLPRLGQLVSLLLTITLIKGIIVYFQGKWTEISSQSVAYDIRTELLEQLAHLSFEFHDRTEAGQILSRAMQDVERLRFLTGRAVLRLVEGTVLIVFTAGALLWMNATLASLIILTLPFLFWRAYAFGSVFRPLSFEIQDKLGDLTTQVEQNLRGIQIVKAFAQEDAEIKRFQTENDSWFKLASKSVRVQAINAPMLDLIANFGTVIIFGYGGLLVQQGELSLGELVAFVTYLAMLVRPVNIMGRIIPILAIASSAAERLFEIIDTQSAVKDLPNASNVKAVDGYVAFDNVSFGYTPEQIILHNISFTAKPGEIIALMGATGSGKSTLINLLARFYDPTSGQISVDGRQIDQLTIRSLRRQIAFVMQDTMLFATSIRENIMFGRPNATEDELIQAAHDAQAYEFIMAMPEKFETVIGERGVTLSGGQKQRIAIARALLSDPRILILDDATASVDTRTEKLIQQALDRLMQGRTTFIIAHRLSTIQRADKILIIENGRITAQGHHSELRQISDLYARVYNLQTISDSKTVTGGAQNGI